MKKLPDNTKGEDQNETREILQDKIAGKYQTKDAPETLGEGGQTQQL